MTTTSTNSTDSRSITAFARPLDGVKVVEACSYLSGPFCAQMLSDLGAEVIKVEPLSGDPYRNFGHSRKGVGVVWANANRGKKSVALDLKSVDDMRKFKTLIEGADLYIENWRPRVSASLGLGAEELALINPRLVHFSITGYGPDGPMAAEPAYDALVQGRTGLLNYEAKGGFPSATNSFIVDKMVAVFCAQMALAGLMARDKSGKGVHLQTSMLDIVAYFNFPDIFHNQTVIGDTAPVNYAPQPVLATKDGYLVLSPVTGKQLGRTLEAVGHPEWKEDFKKITDRKLMTQTFFERIAAPLKERPTAEWLKIFGELDVPAGPVNEPADHLKDPQVIHNKLYSEMESPIGTVRAVRYPGQFNGHLLTPKGPAPSLGQNNDELV
jgi:crotonobetainyl-CoA:carnitine CoA-transferase CaiB-like acyl-CoA transferase